MGTYDTPIVWPTAKLYRDKRAPDAEYASVRDYIVEECLQYHRDLLIKYHNTYMLITYPELVEFMKERHQFHTKLFEEKTYPHKKYQLIDFRWGRWHMLNSPTNPVQQKS